MPIINPEIKPVKRNIKTASDLKYELGTEGELFFSRETMKFHGDSMANYGVRQTKVQVVAEYVKGVAVEFNYVDVYELYRRRPVKYGAQGSTYWAVADLSRVFPHRG